MADLDWQPWIQHSSRPARRSWIRRSVFSALHPLELLFSLPRLFGGGKAGKGVAEHYGASVRIVDGAVVPVRRR